jgi:hypothetical protein
MRTPDQEAMIQQAVAQGPITEAYQADPRQVVRELNRLRATEVTSFLQYKQHAYMAVSMLAPGLKDDFEAHAALELQHADRLAARIQLILIEAPSSAYHGGMLALRKRPLAEEETPCDSILSNTSFIVASTCTPGPCTFAS